MYVKREKERECKWSKDRKGDRKEDDPTPDKKKREREIKKSSHGIQKERKSENESETRDRKGDRKADEPTPGM